MLQTVKAYSGFRAVNAVTLPHVANRMISSPKNRGSLQIMAARVGGVEIPNAKPIEYSLQYIFGIGHTTAKAILVDTVRYPCIAIAMLHVLFVYNPRIIGTLRDNRRALTELFAQRT
jgi:hypothetical protein